MSMSSPPSNAQPPGRSVLIAGTRIRGDIDAPGVLEIQGQVTGHVGADTVVVAEGGRVDGEIKAQAVTVLGQVEGRIETGALRLHASAQVGGDLTYGQIVVDAGADVTATLTRQARAESQPVGK